MRPLAARAAPAAVVTLLAAGAARAQGAQPAPWARPATPGPWPAAAPPPAPGATPGVNPGAWGAPATTPGGVGTVGAMPSGTARDLDQAEREDSGRGLEWFWAQAEGGVNYVGLDAVDGRRLVLEGEKGSAAAPVAGVALGGRVLFFTAGVRARAAFLPAGQLGTLALEGGYHVPLGNFEPYVQIGAGYARLFGNDRPDVSTTAPTTQGFDARLAGGFDYYLAPQFSIGLLANAELLWLWRSGVTALNEAVESEDAATQRRAAEAAKDGSGVGVAAGLTAVAGLHF